MPISHHSHSGQFCSHAKDQLEDVIQAAIAKGMETFAMTEHMPRGEWEDLYPEEIEQMLTTADLAKTFEEYYHEARRLQGKYAGQINLLVGMEIDWIRDSSGGFIEGLLEKYPMDLFVGSVHHVHGIPIDYDQRTYGDARWKAGGTDEGLFEDYFDLQFEMLQRLKPRVVGHFDLIRLWSNDKDKSLTGYGDRVWSRIQRNLEFIVMYGGVIEINSAALRKGMREPYPQAEICKEMLSIGGQFTLSDDSHGIEQIATHYLPTFDFLEATRIDKIVRFERDVHGPSSQDFHMSGVVTTSISLAALKTQFFG